MADCCQSKSCDLEKMNKSQAKVLWTVLVINAVMFAVELASGILAQSLSLTGDSLDMLGDTIAYGSSLYVINRGLRSKAKSAMLKGGIILISAAVVFSRAVYQIIYQTSPEVSTMGIVGFIALAANATCLWLLTKHRKDDINMSSVWLCSRNDIIANSSVLGAAALVYLTGSPWPDLIVGLALTILFTKSGLFVVSEARRELQRV